MTNLKSLKLEKLTFDCLNLVSEVGRFIKDQQDQVTTEDILSKEQNSFVTFVDKQAEAQLIAKLRKLLPKATYITEEDTVENEDSELAWIVDPLDGTTNFLYGIPIYSISLALKAGHEVVIGIVHAIHQKESFYAWHQGGAYLNKKPIQVNQRKELMEALIGTGFPYDKQKRLEKPLKILSSLLAQCRGIRRLGSAAMDLVYVASGRLDCYYESNLNAWDVAAGGKIVLEAGGVVTDFEQTGNWIQGESILAGNEMLHQKLIELIRSV
ncbi:MAG: inositol monophosphatase [Saprospiraceae bacterium]|nr:inositol monophosphatase [Saprospiraceae bacterium]